jgi:hypothetical protein
MASGIVSVSNLRAGQMGAYDARADGNTKTQCQLVFARDSDGGQMFCEDKAGLCKSEIGEPELATDQRSSRRWATE